MKQKQLTRPGLLLRYSKGSRPALFIAAVTSVLAVFFTFMTPQAIRVTVDSVLNNEPFALPVSLSGYIASLGGRAYLREHLLLCAAAAVIFALLAALFTFLCRAAVARFCEETLKRLRDGLYGHIQRLPYAWHTDMQAGDIIQRCTSDVETLHTFLSTQLFELFRTVVLVVIAMAFLFAIDTRLALVCLAFIPVIILYSALFYGAIAGRFLAADEAEGELSSCVQENFTGVRVVRAFGREAYEIERFDAKNTRFTTLWLKLGKLLSVYWGVGDLFTSVQVLAIIVLGAASAVSGRLTLGEFTVFVSYNSMLAWPVRAFGRILGETSKVSVSLKRLCEILNAAAESDSPDGLTPSLTGDVSFEHVTFGYGGAPVLRDVSFTVPAGATVGILGGTGSGKSTLTHLLARLYEIPEGSGRITIGGTDIRCVRLSHLRRNVGLVLQEPFLFSRSVAENLAAGHPGLPLEALREAARTADVDDAVMSFENGYDTLVGERGVTLSGGQKQRVAIARMLLGGAPIQVFDDSLSAVDAETDARIRAALSRRRGAATVLLISHRVTTLMHADNIVVLQDGRVVEEGTHDELVSREGVYRRVFTLQNALAADLTEGGEAR